ncbi:MAG: tetratricopeptide repeat protein [Sandaracinaceae bacterium]|nr:tetratricopeptide repeat protein [Sandaracinaceae bacterium]
MPDALLRLAELRWEQARATYLETFAAWQQVPPESRSEEPPRPDYRVSVQLYDRILTNHRGFDRYDLVLFMKAFAITEAGRVEEALALYRRILAEFPESRFVPDAHMALAESRFAEADFAGALERFDQVLRYRDSDLYGMALFKSAWCLWRLNRTTDAARRFRQVLDLGRGRGQVSADQRERLRELQNEALEYLIQVFTEDESNTAADVFAFLEEIGGERYADRVLVRLASRFYEQDRWERGIEAYGLLLERLPADERAPRWALAVARGQGAIGDAGAAVQALERLAESYLEGSDWVRQQSDPEVVAEARDMIERAIRVRAMRSHDLAQRQNQRALFERAEELYAIYLEHFPESEQSYDLRFYRGEILFHRLERWDDAGRVYLAAAQQSPTGRYTRDALYNAIGAFERVREAQLERCTQQRSARPAAAPPQPAPTPAAATPAAQPGAAPAAAEEPAEGEEPAEEDPCGETGNDLRFATAIELYVQQFPDDPDLPEILFRQGAPLLRSTDLRPGGAPLRTAARALPEQPLRRHGRRAHPRELQPRARLPEHRGLGAAPQELARLRHRGVAAAPRRAHPAGGVRDGPAARRARAARAGRRGVPARRARVPARRARAAGLLQRGARVPARGQPRRRRQRLRSAHRRAPRHRHRRERRLGGSADVRVHRAVRRRGALLRGVRRALPAGGAGRRRALQRHAPPGHRGRQRARRAGRAALPRSLRQPRVRRRGDLPDRPRAGGGRAARRRRRGLPPLHPPHAQPRPADRGEHAARAGAHRRGRPRRRRSGAHPGRPARAALARARGRERPLLRRAGALPPGRGAAPAVRGDPDRRPDGGPARAPRAQERAAPPRRRGLRRGGAAQRRRVGHGRALPDRAQLRALRRRPAQRAGPREPERGGAGGLHRPARVLHRADRGARARGLRGRLPDRARSAHLQPLDRAAARGGSRASTTCSTRPCARWAASWRTPRPSRCRASWTACAAERPSRKGPRRAPRRPPPSRGPRPRPAPSRSPPRASPSGPRAAAGGADEPRRSARSDRRRSIVSIERRSARTLPLPARRLSKNDPARTLPLPLAGGGWGGAARVQRLPVGPTPTLPRERGRALCAS